MVTSESDPSSIAAYATSLRYIFKPGALLDLVLSAPQATHSPTLVHKLASTCTSEPWCFNHTSPLADVHVQHSLIQPHSSDGTALAASSPARALGALSDDDPHDSLRALLHTYNLGGFSEDLIASGIYRASPTRPRCSTRSLAKSPTSCALVVTRCSPCIAETYLT